MAFASRAEWNSFKHDLRVASENASFGLQEVKWAIIPAAGSLARLQRQSPYCKAMESC